MSKIRDFIKSRKEESADSEYDDKLRKHKIKKFRRYAIIVGIVVVVAIFVFLYIENRTYSEYEVESNIMTGDTTKCMFYEYGKGFLRYSNDGLAYIEGSDSIWNQAFEMKTPMIDICKNYVAFAEQNTNEIYIYNTEGLVGKVKTSYPVINLEVAANGVVAAITEETNANHIEIIDTDGTILVTGQTVLSGDGCPVDLSLSEDATKLIVSYLYLNGGVTQTKVVFYNYSEVGKNEVDRVVGGFNQYKSTIVPRVEFITNDIAVAFGDDMYTIYADKQKPSILAEEKIDKEIKSIFYSEEYIGFIFETGEIDTPYELKIINTSGDILYEGAIEIDYRNIKFDGDNVILYDQDTFIVMTVKGKVKFKGNIGSQINEVIALGGKYKYIRIATESIDIVRLK